MSRGQLTEEIKKVSKKFLGYELDRDELRLIPYLRHCCVNHKPMDDLKVSVDEATVANEWVMEGYIAFDEEDMISFSKPFWDFTSEIMWLGYARKADFPDLTLEDACQEMANAEEDKTISDEMILDLAKKVTGGRQQRQGWRPKA